MRNIIPKQKIIPESIIANNMKRLDVLLSGPSDRLSVHLQVTLPYFFLLSLPEGGWLQLYFSEETLAFRKQSVLS